MTLDDLITEARLQLSDPEMPGSGDDSDSLWSNDELTLYVNQAINEACLRSKLIKDASTASVCQIAVSAGTRSYAVSPKITYIDRAKLASGNFPLAGSSVADWDYENANWDSDTGTPTEYAMDYEDGKITLDKEPIANDTLNLIVYRRPLEDIKYQLRKIKSPEIPEEYHYHLIDWVRHLAYEKKDSETYDPDLSMKHYQKFEVTFGPRPVARIGYIHRRRKKHRVRAEFM